MRNLKRTAWIVQQGLRMASLAGVEKVTTGRLYNPYTPWARERIHEYYRPFRERGPIRRLRTVEGWAVFRHADCLTVLQDARYSADDRNWVGWERLQAFQRIDGLVDDSQSVPFLMRSDPPDHTRLRGLVNRPFSARSIAQLQPRVESITNRLLDEVEAKGRFDLLEDFAIPLPVWIIAEMLGIPDIDVPRLKLWSDHLVGFLDPMASPGSGVLRESFEAFAAYLRELAEARRSDPRDDLITALVQAESETGRINYEEILAMVAMILAAGNETVTNLIGNGLRALLEHPDQLERLREDPDGLIDSAIEEMLRWNAPVQTTRRIATEDIDFRGQRFRKGQMVVTVLGSANRDPEAFHAPDTFDIGRSPNPHLGLGHGIHYCIGAPLARLQARVAIPALLQRFPNLRAVSPAPKWRRRLFIRGMDAYHLEV